MEDLRRVQLGPRRNNCVFIILAGSILDYKGDAIINAANEGGTGGFGVDEQVNKAAGYELKEERKKWNGIPTGTARISGSYNHTKVKYIIHAVGPVYRLAALKLLYKPEEQAQLGLSLPEKDPLLVSAYKASLECAKAAGVTILGFTLLSAGVFRGERDLGDILRIGINTIINNCYEGLREVAMIAWTKEEQDRLCALFDETNFTD